MKYKLAPNVTDEMLIKNEFEPYNDEGIITSFCRPSKVTSNELMIAWDDNCAYEKGTIAMRYDYEEPTLKDVQDLIDKGLVIAE